jgi:hypothetical protein
VTHYTIDTESQLQSPPQQSKPALIQIEFLYPKYLSIIILIETLYLPPTSSQTFQLIKQLCQIIFFNNHHIYSWGNAKEELSKFCRYNLFDKDDIDRVNRINVQDEFKTWLKKNHPSSPHVKLKLTDLYSLQFAIYTVFNEWLDKRMTLANWGHGIDLTLNTITISKKFWNL